MTSSTGTNPPPHGAAPAPTFDRSIKMNLKSILASASILLLTGSAMAADQAVDHAADQTTGQGRTRAEVIAETIQARDAGLLNRSEGALDNTTPTPSKLTREQVKAEVIAARNAGELDHSEGYDSMTFFRAPAKTADVKAQMAGGTGKSIQV